MRWSRSRLVSRVQVVSMRRAVEEEPEKVVFPSGLDAGGSVMTGQDGPPGALYVVAPAGVQQGPGWVARVSAWLYAVLGLRRWPE